MPRPQPLTLFAALVISVAGCSASPRPAAPAPNEHALSGLAAQSVAVLPTYSAHLEPGMNWNLGRPTELARSLDNEIASAFDERGLKRGWVFPEQLAESYRRNSTYATDPYQLAEEPLRAPSLAIDGRIPDPLASQIRTLVAFHQDVRLVLAPVELKVEPVGKRGRGVLRLVLLDARASSVKWIGEVVSDTLDSFSPVLAASVASRVAGIVSPR